jgi:tetratricopeptide (TPR) repeat protein
MKYFILILCFFNNVFAEYNFDNQEEYIEYLHKEKEYFRTVSEITRFIFEAERSSDYTLELDKKVFNLKLLSAEIYYINSDHEKCISILEILSKQYENTDRSIQPLYRLGKLYFEHEQYKIAKEYFIKLLNLDNIDDHIKNKVENWLFIISKLTDDKEALINYEENIQYKEISKKYESLELKSPTAAGLYSAIIPGLGQLYLGRDRDAISSFLVNGLFIWGISESSKKDLHSTTAILSLFGIGWYSGNIYGAINGAHKYNRDTINNFKEEYIHNFNLYITENTLKNDKNYIVAYSYKF